MLFLNISTDQIYIQIEDEKINLDRNNIEDIIGPTLTKLYRKYNFKKVFVLNGPGGFTNLRVGTLALNLLNSLENGKINIYSITKIDLFKYFVKNNELSSKGIIYIGQKKNVWLYDFDKGNYETVKKNEIDYNKSLFFDLVYEKGYFEKDNIDIYTKNEKIIIKTNNKELSTAIEKLEIKPEKMIEPKYFIQPIMGKQGQ
ncbi:MAG TPA: hypothetical protein P5060_03500 [Candidatus Absconditabacterales bacterium]|nr:hypothetical protein [Candidatus Absconditabacterales bacterium]